MDHKQAGGCQAANASASTHTIVMQSQKNTKGVHFEKATGVQGLHPAGDDNDEDDDGLMESMMEWSTTLEGHDPLVLGRGMAHQVELFSRVHTLVYTHRPRATRVTIANNRFCAFFFIFFMGRENQVLLTLFSCVVGVLSSPLAMSVFCHGFLWDPR